MELYTSLPSTLLRKDLEQWEVGEPLSSPGFITDFFSSKLWGDSVYDEMQFTAEDVNI